MGFADSGEGVSKIISSRTSRSSWEACDSIPGDLTRVREEGESREVGDITVESRMDRLGTTDSFGFGVGTSTVLINGPEVDSGDGPRTVGVICGGWIVFGWAETGVVRAERRDFRSGVAGAARKGSL